MASSAFVPNMSCGPCLYCGGVSAEAPEALLRCDLCKQPAHVTCLRSGQPETCLQGDNFFNFTCATCLNSNKDTVSRSKLSSLHLLLLVMYNLHLTQAHSSRGGFFHWKVHVHNFINNHWKDLFGPNSQKKKRKVLQSSLSGQLSYYTWYFMSGYKILRDGGWYRLAAVVSPAQLIHQHLANKTKSKKRSTTLTHSMEKRFHTEKLSEGGAGTTEEVCNKDEPHESTSSGDVSFDSPDDSSRGSWFTERDFLKPQTHPPKDLFDSEGEDDRPSTSLHKMDDVKEEEVVVKEECVEETECGGSECGVDIDFVDVGEYGGGDSRPVSRGDDTSLEHNPLHIDKVSLFTKPRVIMKEWQPKQVKEEPPQQNLRRMSRYEEQKLLSELRTMQESRSLPPHLVRLIRKLEVRKAKVEHGLPLFNLDEEVSFFHSHGRFRTRKERRQARTCRDLGEAEGRVLDRFQVCNDVLVQKQDKTASLLVRLLGSAEEATPFIFSPYTLRQLKPYIWRDYSAVPAKLKLLQEIIAFPHRNDPSWCPPPKPPIDYCYVSAKHIPAMNHLARQFFWPGIDLSEVLQYPDHTCVVLYRRLVIAFGVLVPDVSFNVAYLSFLLVHPEWRRAGLATFILYHLIQTCLGKDVTLHVSATNPALMLYQRFGFKVEEFLSNFYDKYLAEDSPECKHAMFLRLSR